MASVTVSANVSQADTKRIQASGFEDMAKSLRSKVKREKSATADVFRQVALYIEAQAEFYRLEADTLDQM